MKPGICTPQNPSQCGDRFNQMLDPRAGKSKEALAAMDARDAKELDMLKGAMASYSYSPSKSK